MPDEARVLTALFLAFGAALVATPIAIRIARKTNFHDEPARYKAHPAPTPYLGGAAVIFAFTLSALLFAESTSRFAAIVVGAVALWVVGTIDDRRTLRPVPRVLAAGGAAGLLWIAGLGWSVFQNDGADLALTFLWVIGLVNAFNLMDNMDGAAPTVAAVSGSGVALAALVSNDVALAALALALVGACIGFLKYNLASPARVFLGDGGSMPIGFILAAAVMSLPELSAGGIPMLVPAALLVGLAIFDTILVVVSRSRRRVRICSGARDHVTHRLLPMLRTPRAVAVVLAFVQTILCGLAIAAVELGPSASSLLAVPSVAAGLIALHAFERRTWSPVKPASRETVPADGRVLERPSDRALHAEAEVSQRVDLSPSPAGAPVSAGGHSEKVRADEHGGREKVGSSSPGPV